eukprot:gene58231-79744_t
MKRYLSGSAALSVDTNRMPQEENHMDIANGIDSLAKLAGQARGIEMNSIDNCAGDPGLPDVVPI